MLPENARLMRIRIVSCIHSRKASELIAALARQADFRMLSSISLLEESLQQETLLSIPEILLLEVDTAGECFRLVERIRKNVLLSGLFFVMLAP